MEDIKQEIDSIFKMFQDGLITREECLGKILLAISMELGLG